MPKTLVRVMVVLGLALAVAGVVMVFFAGGWAATGVGTNHSGSFAGVVGAMLVGWGVVLVVATLFTAAMMRATRRRLPAA